VKKVNFFWAGLLFWLLIGVSIFFLIWGLIKKRAIHFVLSALLFSPIAYYFSGAENAFKLIMFYPIVPLLLAVFFVPKKTLSN
jgi:hypothetical protein